MKRVLVVEDDVPVGQIAAKILSRRLSGVEVVVRLDGKDALRELSSGGPYDVVLTDLMMPRMTGYELTRTIRAGDAENGSHGTSRNVLIGCVATVPPREPEAELFNFVIRKPYDVDRFAATVGAFLFAKNSSA